MSEENAFKINDKYSSADFINDVKECLTGKKNWALIEKKK